MFVQEERRKMKNLMSILRRFSAGNTYTRTAPDVPTPPPPNRAIRDPEGGPAPRGPAPHASP